ncbi:MULTISPECIES: hypothetical protein [Mycobacterium]|uniref:arsenate reductase/protein-tyrosine-phosphatase family protein n=1 Tax=Mycobacterium TaxID=1763 RepID=UPI0009F36E87|nr:hypothetical protein E0T84_15950 [Mycobacterium sp. DBP42]
MSDKSVWFVCVSNTGKSVMAAGLMRHIVAPNIHIHSAGTQARTGFYSRNHRHASVSRSRG